MKPLLRAIPLVSALVISVLGIAGCTTYKYTTQKDSASVRGTEPPFFARGAAQATIALVKKIDGGIVLLKWDASSATLVSLERTRWSLALTIPLTVTMARLGPFQTMPSV